MNPVQSGSDLSALMNRDRVVHTFTVPRKLQQHGIKTMGLVELTAEEEITAQKSTGFDISRIGAELAKASLRFINGTALSVADGSLQRAVNDMHPKVRSLLAQAYSDIHNVKDDESEGFLESRAQSVG